MNPAPDFAPYPLPQPPVYSRWLIGGGVLLVLLVGSHSALMHDAVDASKFSLVISSILGLLVWLLALLLRVVFHRISRHNARCYVLTARQIQRSWWARHRQKAALVEAVLLGPGCQTLEHRQRLFSADHPAPVPQETPMGTVLRVRQVRDDDRAGRERQLAILLVLQWREQSIEPVVLKPLCCYWQGTLEAWDAFVEQMAASCPQVELPERPEPWMGIGSLDSIIDQLQDVPADTRILCAGCQSTVPRQDNRLPAGEAAVLWLLGPESGPAFSRGEWFADSDSLGKVAERALQQSELDAPTDACVSFSRPDVPTLSATGWNVKQNVQDPHFGALAHLEAMVVQTLAAWYAEQQGRPCAWLACDPHYTLALGIVKPHDSSR